MQNHTHRSASSSHIFGAIAPSTQVKGAALGRNYTQNPPTNPVPVSPYRGALRGANGRFGPMGIGEEAKEKLKNPERKTTPEMAFCVLAVPAWLLKKKAMGIGKRGQRKNKRKTTPEKAVCVFASLHDSQRRRQWAPVGKRKQKREKQKKNNARNSCAKSQGEFCVSSVLHGSRSAQPFH